MKASQWRITAERGSMASKQRFCPRSPRVPQRDPERKGPPGSVIGGGLGVSGKPPVVETRYSSPVCELLGEWALPGDPSGLLRGGLVLLAAAAANRRWPVVFGRGLCEASAVSERVLCSRVCSLRRGGGRHGCASGQEITEWRIGAWAGRRAPQRDAAAVLDSVSLPPDDPSKVSTWCTPGGWDENSTAADAHNGQARACPVEVLAGSRSRAAGKYQSTL